jgi:glycosyltransferase involved in cell wall biosynthesis
MPLDFQSVKILIATDAWLPQTNGVVNTLRHTAAALEAQQHVVALITPAQFRTIPCPSYPEIRLSLFPGSAVQERIERFDPDAIHIATEGPIGVATRRLCLARGMPFTSSYHTQFPEYLRSRVPIPLGWSYAAMRRFHGAAEHCMVSTQSMQERLEARGFRNIVRWQRGVDTKLFYPRPKDFLPLARPVAIYVGRLAVEKNIDAFLKMAWRGTKVVVGDGPDRARLQQRYPDAVFRGFRFGVDLARHLAAADVMVFPSVTDTFGLVNLESMACGVPVAAFPVPGPIDVVEEGVTGALDWDLAAAARRAVKLAAEPCRARAEASDWNASTRQFAANLVDCRARWQPQEALS